MAGERGACLATVARDDVQEAVRQSDIGRKPGEFEGAERRFPGWFDHGRVPSGKRGCNAPSEQVDRNVPRNDVGGNSEWFANGVIDVRLGEWNALALNLVRDTSIVFEVASCTFDLATRFCQWFPVFQRLDLRKSFLLIADCSRNICESASTFGWRPAMPRLKRIMGDANRFVDVVIGSYRDSGEFSFRRRIKN